MNRILIISILTSIIGFIVGYALSKSPKGVWKVFKVLLLILFSLLAAIGCVTIYVVFFWHPTYL